MKSKPNFLIIDLFCGAGGTSTGFHGAKNGIAKVIACVNHDAIAIKSHWANYPDVKHFDEDILTLDLTELVRITKENLQLYPQSKLILWASLECTNFSKAKGGQARDADSRTLAWGLPRYIEALNPDYVQIENVVEFMSWGEIDEKGKPISRKKGTDWMKWREFINNQYGYYDEWKEMNAANFGSYTSRNRLFGCFAKLGLPIKFPKSTHSKNPSKDSMFGDLKKWRAVKDVLDFEDEGTSIFNRKISLVEASLERIYAGLVKHIQNGGSNFILKYNSKDANGKHNPPSVDEPCHTIACQNRLGLVSTNFMVRYYSGNPDGKFMTVDNPAGVITTIDHHCLVSTNFLNRQNGNDKGCLSIEAPAPTLTTVNKISKIEATYILNPSHGGHTQTIDAPCPVIVARQDKAPLYLINCLVGNFSIPVYENDSPMMKKIKEFMSKHGIVDIKMRMLKVLELLKIQGFPDDYKLYGNQADMKKFIGNSVVPLVVKKWIEALNQAFELNLCSTDNFIKLETMPISDVPKHLSHKDFDKMG